MALPRPPNLAALLQEVESANPETVTPPPPPPLNIGSVATTISTPKGSASLVVEEKTVNEIIRETLKPIHQTDPNIIRFISNYIETRDVKQASRLSNLNPKDGKVLFNRKDIFETIKKITEIQMDKFGYNVEETVERVKEIAFVDPLDLQNPDGSYKVAMADLPVELRRAIKKMKVRNLFGKDENGIDTKIGEIVDIEFWDKIRSLELLGREKEVFKEKKTIEHDVSKNMRDVLLASRERAHEVSQSIRDVTATKMIESKSVGEIIDDK